MRGLLRLVILAIVLAVAFGAATEFGGEYHSSQYTGSSNVPSTPIQPSYPNAYEPQQYTQATPHGQSQTGYSAPPAPHGNEGWAAPPGDASWRGYSGSVDPQQQQQQQQLQQQQQQYGGPAGYQSPPPQGYSAHHAFPSHPHTAFRQGPPGVPPSANSPYGRPDFAFLPPRQPENTGFFSKIKSSIAAAGSAIASGIDSVSSGGPQQPFYGSRMPPPPPPHGYPHPQAPGYPPTTPEAQGGVMHKIKNYLSDDQPNQGYPPQGYGPSSTHPNTDMTQPSSFESSTWMPDSLNSPSQTTREIPTDPQLIIQGDSVILILKPVEFHRKKAALVSAGPAALQVFSNFEQVFTRLRDQNGQRALGSAELLESSGAISPDAMAQITQLAEEFGSMEADYEAFEEMTTRVQQILTRSGNLQLAAVPNIVRDLTSKLALRDGWKDVIQNLAQRHVPTYLFSSGYGDVIAHVILQAGLDLPPVTSSPGGGPVGSAGLPSNLCIISNFFRAAPDGIVRGFSSPVVHERNKNSTTAERHTSMPIPTRPHALILGSHEEDVLMTDQLNSVKEQLSIGFLELAEDLPQRLPTYLSTYDAVILGDGSFSFVRSLLEDVLHLPKRGDGLGLSNVGSLVGSRIGQMRKGLAGFLNAGSDQHYSPQHPMR